MSAYVIHFTGMITEDGKQLLIDDQAQLKADYKLLAGYEVAGEIRKRRSKRSLRQNAWFHSFIVPFAESIGELVPDLKLAGLIAVFGTKQVHGYTVPVYAHTSDLDTSQFSDLCEWFVEQAARCNFVVLYPEEFRRQKKQEQRAAQKGLAKSA